MNETGIAAATSSQTHTWETPDAAFLQLHHEFRFTLDGAASAHNAKLERWLGPGSAIAEDALAVRWAFSDPIPERVFLNPPYGRDIGAWMEKACTSARQDGALVVCLVPARTDTRWWWDWARWGEVRFVRGRIRFVPPPGAPPKKSGGLFPSAVVIFRPGVTYPSAGYMALPLK